MQKTAIIVGATGLIGSELLQLLLEDDAYSCVKVIARKTTSITHPKLEEHLINFDEIDKHEAVIQGDVAFCCLGTTQKKSGKKGLYKVDFTYVHAFARLAAHNGVKRFVVVSSLGAKKSSRYYYYRVKAEMEEAVAQLPFEAVHILRPSLLIGDRDEVRILEDLGRVFFTAFSPFIPHKYRAVRGKTVAVFMQKIAEKAIAGCHVYESNRIRRIAVKKFDMEKMLERTEYKDIKT